MSRKPKVVTSMLAYGEGALLRQLRMESDISLTEMSDKLHYQKSFLSAIETGAEKASQGVIDGYEKVLGLKPGELRDRIAAMRTESPERTIALLTRYRQPWLDILPGLFHKSGKDGVEPEESTDERRQHTENYQRGLELALKNAAERLLAQSQNLEEMKRRQNILAVLSEPSKQGEVLRVEGLADFFTSLPSFTGQELINAHQQ